MIKKAILQSYVPVADVVAAELCFESVSFIYQQ